MDTKEIERLTELLTEYGYITYERFDGIHIYKKGCLLDWKVGYISKEIKPKIKPIHITSTYNLEEFSLLEITDLLDVYYWFTLMLLESDDFKNR